MTNEQIQELALASGFKLKEQPDGLMALNPYVFEFARALLAASSAEMNIPDGWPTEEMIIAGNRAYWWEHDGNTSNVESYDQKMRRAFLAMLAAAPTPPAQDDEPVAWMDVHDNWVLYKNKPSQVDVVPLYTRPDNSELRKAAERVIHCWRRENWTDGMPDLSTCLKWLNDALEGK